MSVVPDFMPTKSSVSLLQMRLYLPIHLLGERRVPNSIGMGQAIATRYLGPANLPQRTFIHAQRVAHIVQTPRVRQLSKNHRHQMAPEVKRPSFVLNVQFACRLDG